MSCSNSEISVFLGWKPGGERVKLDGSDDENGVERNDGPVLSDQCQEGVGDASIGVGVGRDEEQAKEN